MPNDLTRRAFLAAPAALALVWSLPRPAAALDVARARELIGRLVAEINAIINSGKPEQAMYRDFEDVFVRYADVPTIARSALGPAARQASAAELRAYTAAFQGYIARKYGKRFREFIGGRIEVTGARAVQNFYEVISTAFLRGRSPFEVRWHVSDRSGRELFFNMYIEGVNMLAAERTEIGAMLDRRRGNIAALTEDLKSAG